MILYDLIKTNLIVFNYTSWVADSMAFASSRCNGTARPFSAHYSWVLWHLFQQNICWPFKYEIVTDFNLIFSRIFRVFPHFLTAPPPGNHGIASLYNVDMENVTYNYYYGYDTRAYFVVPVNIFAITSIHPFVVINWAVLLKRYITNSNCR